MVFLKENKREGYLIALVLLGLYLSLGENLIPKPFPWMKLGLANIVTLIALEKFNSKMAFEIFFLRIGIQGMMLGTIFTPGFIVSLIAGGTSIFLTVFLYKFRQNLSLMAISSMSAFAHNVLQLIVVYFLLFRNVSLYSRSIIIFILIFLSLGIAAGLITGYITERLNLRKRELSL
jgi:heptaprenyl diphosphate synthase